MLKTGVDFSVNFLESPHRIQYSKKDWYLSTGVRGIMLVNDQTSAVTPNSVSFFFSPTSSTTQSGIYLRLK